MIVLVGLLALSFCIAMAADHSPLQDFCVAQSNSQGIKLLEVDMYVYIWYLPPLSKYIKFIVCSRFYCSSSYSIPM